MTWEGSRVVGGNTAKWHRLRGLPFLQEGRAFCEAVIEQSILFYISVQFVLS